MKVIWLAALAGLIALPAAGTGAEPQVGELAPDFEMTLVDGSKVRLDDVRGSVVVINFWATWCVPCRAELPLLDSYYTRRRDAGLRVFAVTTEGSLPLFQLKKLFAVLHIPSVRKIKGPYRELGAVPTNYIIDRAGRIRYARAGAFGMDELNAELVPLLREAPPGN